MRQPIAPAPPMSERRMAKVKYITSPDELPAGQNYVLVMYGEEYAQTRHPLGLIITVARQ
jgi:hypothetical protein